MDLDAKVKKRRLSEMENELAKLRQERDLLEYELKEAQEERQREKASRLKATEECRKQEEDLNNTISSLESELQNSKQSQLPLKTNPDAWKARVSELEQEVFYLRLLLKDWYPEHELASQLRSKHVEFEHEMHESHKTVEDLLHAKERILSLEQEKISLQAALEIQEASLKQCKDAASQSTRAKQDQALYEASIADIPSCCSAAGARAARGHRRSNPQPTCELHGPACIPTGPKRPIRPSSWSKNCTTQQINKINSRQR